MPKLMPSMPIRSGHARYARRARCGWLAAALLPLAFAGCATGGGAPGNAGGAERGAATNGARVAACRAGDRAVASESQCLQDDAACYPITSGEWCTGTRANACPAGSSPLAAGQACPPGAPCFAMGESLTCVAGG